jgi:guanine deaminase
MDSMRQALIASKVIHINSHQQNGTEGPDVPLQYKALNYKQVFYLATLGGAKVLGLEEKIGNFKVGKQFDAIVVDTSFSMTKPMLMDNTDPAPGMDVFEHDDHWAIFEKFIYLGDDRQMTKIYVDGEPVV